MNLYKIIWFPDSIENYRKRLRANPYFTTIKARVFAPSPYINKKANTLVSQVPKFSQRLKTQANPNSPWEFSPSSSRTQEENGKRSSTRANSRPVLLPPTSSRGSSSRPLSLLTAPAAFRAHTLPSLLPLLSSRSDPNLISLFALWLWFLSSVLYWIWFWMRWP